jgi:pimeloyl-ACP methyl ester carboxylesterase
LDSKKRVSEDFIQTLEDPRWLAIDLDDGLLSEINVPGMLIYGNREKGAIVSQAVAEGVQKRVEGLQLVHLPEATHDIRRTQFAGYLSAVQDFLRQVLVLPSEGIRNEVQ